MRLLSILSFRVLFTSASSPNYESYSIDGLEWGEVSGYVEVQMMQIVEPKGWYWAEVRQNDSEYWVVHDDKKATFKYHHDILNVFKFNGFEYVSERHDKYNVYYLLKRN